MKIRAIFETEAAPRIELVPETPGEKTLLAAVLNEDVHGRVNVKYDGHASYGRAEMVSITLKEGKN